MLTANSRERKSLFSPIHIHFKSSQPADQLLLLLRMCGSPHPIVKKGKINIGRRSETHLLAQTRNPNIQTSTHASYISRHLRIVLDMLFKVVQAKFLFITDEGFFYSMMMKDQVSSFVLFFFFFLLY